MPAVKKVSREEIIDAAVDVLRDGGFSSVNARSVAKKLGCSTQPIYFSFKNMDELKTALTERAIQMHTKRVNELMREYRKEFFSEGQLFYFYKRHNYKTFPYCVKEDMSASYQWPLPDNEKTFGNNN